MERRILYFVDVLSQVHKLKDDIVTHPPGLFSQCIHCIEKRSLIYVMNSLLHFDIFTVISLIFFFYLLIFGMKLRFQIQ